MNVRQIDPHVARRQALALALAGVALAACGSESPPSSGSAGPPALPPASATAPAAGLPADTPAAATAVSEVAVEIAPGRGIDVSAYSGSVDWSRVRADGQGFVFLKATEGQDLEDPAFDAHWPQIKAAGLVRGAYHFYVTEDDPAAQARFFIDTVRLQPGDLAPVVDIELIGHGTPPGLAQRLRTFLDLLESHYGIKPIIYTTASFWDAHLDDTFGAYPLWVAEYGVETPRLPAGWQSWHLWQWRGDASVSGVEKGADLSRANAAAGVDFRSLLISE